jgi:hypothetical protein
LAIGFSDYSNTIKIYYNKIELQSYSATVNSGGYKSVAITVTQDGKVTIVHGGITICSNYQLPAAYATDNKSGWQYALAARCGALNNYHSVKNVVIKDNDVQYKLDNGNFTSATTFTGVAAGTHTIYARQSNGANCSNVTTVGTATIAYTPDITATVAATSPTTCASPVGTITISNVSPGLSSPYDLVNISLTNNQLGAATIGNLGTCCNPIWGGFGDLVLTPNTSNRAGYIAFNSTVATPNAFSANYDVFVGGGNGGDGLSFNYGNLNTAGTAGTAAESGMVNSGLAIGFSDYSNTIKIYYNKIELQSYSATVNSGGYKSVAITVTYDGKLTLVYGGTTICSNYQLPAAYATDSKSNWQYALAARCGASNNYHSVKNVVIKDNSIQYTINGNTYTENPIFTNVASSTYNVRARISNGTHCSILSSLGSVTITPPPGMVAITGQPDTTTRSLKLNATATTLSVTATGADTLRYQWYSNTTAINSEGNPIVGATSASYTPPTSAIGTLYYYCIVSNACSDVKTAISGSVTIYLPAPNISYTTPNTFNVGTLISPLIPTNMGGEIRSTTFSTFAGSGSIGSTDGTGTAASFKFPDNVIMDKSGNLFVADRSNHLIRKITPSGVVTTFAGNGTAASVDGTGTGASINFPSGLAFDTIGNLYVGERQGYKIRKITPNGVVTTLAGSGTKASVNGTGTAASFDFIEKITIDKSTNDLYVCEGNSRKIRKVTSLGVVTTFAGSGAFANSEGTGTAASFIEPLGITIDANKNLYVTSGELIFKITPSAVVTRYAGTPGTYGSADGTTTSATFNYGSGITIDASGNFYVVDLGGLKIRKISTSGIVSTISGTGSAGSPRGLVLDASGNNLYVADYGHKIRKIALGGGYTITPALPAGLSMDANTGIISGTPSLITAATDYTIIANNDAGSDSFNINIKVSTVCNPTISSNSIAICSSELPYSWNGLTFNAAGTQTKTGLTNAGGCDSSATLTVTVKAVTSSSNSIAICSSALPYSWNGLTFNAAGTQTKTGLTNAAGCDSSATLTITVKAVTSSSNSIAICSSALPYSWNGLTFTAAGTQTKTGLTNAAGCDSSATLTVTVKTTTTSSNDVNVCTNQLPYSWNGQSYNAAGSYTKTGLVNSQGCDSTATLNLTIGSPVTPTVSISKSSVLVCSGNEVSFTANGVNGGSSPSYQWFKNGTMAGNGTTITFTAGTLATGDTVYCVLTANNPCQTTATVTSNKIGLTVKMSPVVTSITNGVASITTSSLCILGSTYKYYNNTPYGVWSSDNIAIASVIGGSQAGVVTANTNGSATIKYTVSNTAGCSSSASLFVKVAQQATPNAITGVSSACVGTTTALSNTTPSGVWSSINDRGTINVSGIYAAANSGAGQVKYTVTNASGCSAFSSKTITVNAKPAVPTITYAPGTPNPQLGAPTGGFCVGKKFRVVATPNVPAGVWSATGFASFTGYDTVNVNAVGAGSIKYTYTSAAGCSNSRTLSGNGFTCAARGVSVSGEGLVVSGDFTMYPNPAKGYINLNVETLVGAGSIVVTDLYGKTVKTQALSMGTNTVNVSNLSKGMYFVSTITNEGKTTKKLVVE